MVSESTPDILKQIVELKRKEVERHIVESPQRAMHRVTEDRGRSLDFANALRGDSVKVIAEIKKASPSKGVLREDFDPAELARAYTENGAAAISVLTEVDHFQGSLNYMRDAQEIANPKGVPILRKDFIFDRYQIFEARYYGADAVLLIVAMLTPEMLKNLFHLTKGLMMHALVEVHDERELETALEVGADIIGINNRDLRTFHTDIAVTEKLAPMIPRDRVIVSESGINSREDIKRVQSVGANAVLVGEAFVTADDPGAKLAELI